MMWLRARPTAIAPEASCIHVQVWMEMGHVWWDCGSMMWLACTAVGGARELLVPPPWRLPQILPSILLPAIKHELKRNISCRSMGTGTWQALAKNGIWEYLIAREIDAISQILNRSTKLSLPDNQQKGSTEAFWKQNELLFPLLAAVRV